MAKTYFKNNGVWTDTKVITDNYGIVPSGTLPITDNGTYDVTNYASASVNVEKGSIPIAEDVRVKKITANIALSGSSATSGYSMGNLPIKITGKVIIANNASSSSALNYSVYTNLSSIPYNSYYWRGIDCRFIGEAEITGSYFSRYNSSTEYQIPVSYRIEGVKTLPSGFYYSKNLPSGDTVVSIRELDLPDVEEIEDNVFYFTTSTSVTSPTKRLSTPKVKYIGNNFRRGGYFDNDDDIYLPEIITIGDNCFYGSRSLQGNVHIIIGPNCTSIGNNSFSFGGLGSLNVALLTDNVVYLYPKVPPTLGTNSFKIPGASIICHIPVGSLQAYQNAPNYPTNFNYVEDL